MNSSRNKSPLNSTEYAWRVAVNPDEFSKSDRKLLVKRALEKHYSNENQGVRQDILLKDVAEFVRQSIERPTKEKVVVNPPDVAKYPGKLALLLALGSVLVRRHNVIASDPREPRIHEYVRDYYRYILIAVAKHSTADGIVQKEIGRVVYARKQQDTYGPPPGQLIEDVTLLPGFAEPFYKIPLVHANRYCISRSDSPPQNQNNNSDLTCVVKGPYVYVPVSDAEEKYKREFTRKNGVAYLLEEMIHLSIGDKRLDAYQKSMTGLNKRIEQLNSQGQDHILFKERNYPAKLEAILQAIDNADTETAAIGDKLTAKEVYNVIQEHASETDVDWIRNVLDSMDSPKSVGQTLAKFVKDPDIKHVTATTRDGKPNLYQFQYSIGGVNKINVQEISDLLELPCMQNLHESLQEGKPIRWELYSFVRYLFEVNTAEFTVEDIKDWFSQYPWYREKVTEYQANYEKEQRMADGDRPLPISCRNDNDNWAKHCIGMENCEYSLYRSVELRPDVYDRISDS